MWKYLQNTFTPKAYELGKVHLTPPLNCHMSCVTCHVSCVTCHMSHLIFFLQSGVASWWRVCYQWGLPCLFFTASLMFLKGLVIVKLWGWGWGFFSLLLQFPKCFIIESKALDMKYDSSSKKRCNFWTNHALWMSFEI